MYGVHPILEKGTPDRGIEVCLSIASKYPKIELFIIFTFVLSTFS